MNRLFVYGTLVPGRSAEQIMMLSIPGEFSYTAPAYDVINVSNGGCALTHGNHVVGGFTYLVSDDQLEQLDEYEDSCYARSLIQMSNGSTAYAYMLDIDA